MYLIFPVVINPRYYEPPTYLSCHHISRWPGQPPVDPVLNQCARLISNGVWDTQATPVDRHGERWGICWNHVQTSLGSFILGSRQHAHVGDPTGLQSKMVGSAPCQKQKVGSAMFQIKLLWNIRNNMTTGTLCFQRHCWK